MRIRVVAAATWGFILSIAAAAAFAQSAPIYDLVIRNGRLLDGNGNPWVKADVAIKDGRFAKLGRVEGRGTREIDAQGDYVSPGWIDMMDQSGEVLLKNGIGGEQVARRSNFRHRRRRRHAGAVGKDP